MANVLSNYFFSRKFLVRVAFVALSLGYGVSQAHTAEVKPPANSGNQANWKVKPPIKDGNQANWLAGGGG